MGANERLYRWLMRLILPAAFRAEAESEMLEVFRDGLVGTAGLPRLRFLARSVADLGVTAWREWRERPVESASAGRETWSGVIADLSTSVREAVRRPVGAAAQAITLGIGIAATLLVLVLVRDVLMRPLPFEEPDRLVRLREAAEDGGVYWPSWRNIRDWRENATAVEGIVAANVGNVNAVLVGGVALREPVGEVSRGFFETLGVEPVRGRTFTSEENSPGGPPVALIGESLWRGALGGRALEELTLTIGRDEHRVVGVLPAGFRFLGNGGAWIEASVWLPLERTPGDEGRMSHGYHTIARLRPGIGIAEARRSLDALAVQLKAEHGEETHADRILVGRLGDAVSGSARTPLRLLLIASFAVLVVACLNLAAAMLARGITRDREFAIRAAIGARRSDLVRLQLVHALVLAVPGALLGSVGAWVALSVIRDIAPGSVPRIDQATLDPAAVAMALLLAVGSAFIAGAIPAMILSVTDVARRMRTRDSMDTRGRRRVWDMFVGAQAGLTLVLLVSSVMLLRSLLAALSVDIGYDASDVTVVSVSLPETRYAEPGRRVAFHEQLLERLRGRPEIVAAGITNIPPDEIYAWIGRTSRPEDESRSMWSGYRIVDPGFFEVLRVPVQAGELSRSSGVLVDRQLVDELFDGESPVGQRVRSSAAGMTFTVSGVTGSMRQWDQSASIGSVYQDFRQQPELLLSMHVLVRGDAATIADAVRSTMNEVDPLVPYSLASLDGRIRATMSGRALMLFIALGFALVSLLLAAVGIHALVAQSVARRQRESGIRLVLGAVPGQVHRRLAGLGVRSALIGIAAGALGAPGAAHAIRSQLFGLDTLDPLSLFGSIAVLSAVAWVAAWLPARKAGRVDPAGLLRES